MSILDKMGIEAMDEKGLEKVAGGVFESTPRDYPRESTPRDYPGALNEYATTTNAFQTFKYLK